MSKNRFRICKLNNGRYIIQREYVDYSCLWPDGLKELPTKWADLDDRGRTRSEVESRFNDASLYYDIGAAQRALESFRDFTPLKVDEVVYEDPAERKV